MENYIFLIMLGAIMVVVGFCWIAIIEEYSVNLTLQTVAATVIFVVGMMLLLVTATKQSEKNATIEALNGEPRWQKVYIMQPDSTITDSTYVYVADKYDN